jgi:hypothetical protein
MIYRNIDYPHIVMNLSIGRLDTECEGCGAKHTLKFALNEANPTEIIASFRDTVREWKANHIKCKRTVH